MNQSLLGFFKKFGIVVAVAAAFVVGLSATVLLSLHSPDVTVPDVTGKSRGQAEKILKKHGLHLASRASRFSKEEVDTVLDQTPHPNEVIKAGTTVRVVLSKGPEKKEAKSDKTDDSKADNSQSGASEQNGSTGGDGKGEDQGEGENASENANRERKPRRRKIENVTKEDAAEPANKPAAVPSPSVDQTRKRERVVAAPSPPAEEKPKEKKGLRNLIPW